MGRKNENGGFSLIELLVSIVILVVVAIPLLHSFYTVANTNTKSKRVLNATTAGQNLMEQIKSEALKDTMAGAVDESGNTVTGLAENPAKIMKKTFEGISVNGQLYRADVTLDPTSYLGIINADGSLTSDDRDYNSTPIANLSNMSNETSAFYLMSEEDDTDAANDIDAENPDDTLADLKREISVEVSRNASAEITVKVQVYYNDELAKEQTVYAGKKGLENIFLFYYPLYNGKENITLQNPENIPLKLYLVRQLTDKDRIVVLSSPVTVKLQEGAPADISNTGVSRVRVLANEKPDVSVSYEQNGIPYMDAIAVADLTDEQAKTRIYDINIKVYRNDDDAKTKLLAELEGTKTE